MSQQNNMDDRHVDLTSPGHALLELALAQLAEDARVYNKAVRSFNTHLENHRDRRDLHDLPRRRPVTDLETFEEAVDGDREALECLLSHVLEGAHLDSAVRRHPRVYPIHIEAVEQLEIARNQLVSTLEEALRHLDSNS